MKILCIADDECKALYDNYVPESVRDVELIISCGDLSADYLDYIQTMSGIPLLYVPGNHDRYYLQEPDRCTCIDDDIFVFNGIRIAGLGGSIEYRPSVYMFTEEEMEKRANALSEKVCANGGIDILVTHAPVRGYGDKNDLPHQGFQCFDSFLAKHKPKYMLHGHVHGGYQDGFSRELPHSCGTTIINCFERYMLDYN